MQSSLFYKLDDQFYFRIFYNEQAGYIYQLLGLIDRYTLNYIIIGSNSGDVFIHTDIFSWYDEMKILENHDCFNLNIEQEPERSNNNYIVKKI